VSATSQSFLGIKVHNLRAGIGFASSKIGVPSTAHWQMLLPLEDVGKSCLGAAVAIVS
jgi:hypothetical protein